MADRLDYRVKLRNLTNKGEVVIFETTPDLIETRNINYKTVDPIHAPGQIYAYINTSSRSFNISSVRLVSRTQEEAELNLRYLWRLRSWGMPAFGKDPVTGEQRESRDFLLDSYRRGEDAATLRQLQTDLNTDFGGLGVDTRGQPPAVLLLSAYAADAEYGKRGHINRVPVVIQNLSIPYPSDVDYIPTRNGIPMPTIMTIDMTLVETHSPREYENFSLRDFKQGKLKGF